MKLYNLFCNKKWFLLSVFCVLFYTYNFSYNSNFVGKKNVLQAVIIEVKVLQSSLQNKRKGFEEKQIKTENQNVNLHYRDKFFQIEFSALNAKDSNKTVADYLKESGDVKVTEFKRVALG